jgi:hypothetical protein
VIQKQIIVKKTQKTKTIGFFYPMGNLNMFSEEEGEKNSPMKILLCMLK